MLRIGTMTNENTRNRRFMEQAEFNYEVWKWNHKDKGYVYGLELLEAVIEAKKGSH